MANLITCRALSKGFAGRMLFQGLNISFDDEERTGLIGPNGAGKSTLLRLLAGEIDPDQGEVQRRRGGRVAYVPQDEQFPADATPLEILAAKQDAATRDVHEREAQAQILLGRLGFPDPQQPLRELSGGWRKRLSVAGGLIQEPDLLLLDEPTNHLDLVGVLWLEQLLRNLRSGFVVITHDRYFLAHIVNRMVELNPAYPDGYFGVAGGYERFLEKRDEFLAGQRGTQQALASRARRELAFLQSNSKAQRTKSKRRTEDAYELLDELADTQRRNAAVRAAGIDFAASGRQTRKLIFGQGLTKSFGARELFRDVDVFLSPGVRLGLLGANGTGKSTLIRLLTKQLEPDAGAVQHAERLQVVVFDQRRAELPRDVLLREALAGRLDSVQFRGQNIHVTAWAERFLFRASQLDTPVRELSGGEQARILIARLMLQPADVLILDEPTNDLDIPSLDVLEESLLNFPGAIVLVTHDRFLLERVCTEMLALLGDGRAVQIPSVSAWEDVLAAMERQGSAGASKARGRARGSGGKAAGGDDPGGKRLTYGEQIELREMEAKIAAAEAALAVCSARVNDPKIAADHVALQEACHALELAQQAADALYTRWHDLEERRAATG